MFCGECGKEMSENALFCPYCGCAVQKNINWSSYRFGYIVIDGNLYLSGQGTEDSESEPWYDEVYLWNKEDGRFQDVEWERSEKQTDGEAVNEHERNGYATETYKQGMDEAEFQKGLYETEQGISSTRMERLLGIGSYGYAYGLMDRFSVVSMVNGNDFEDVIDRLLDEADNVKKTHGNPVKYDFLYAHIVYEELGRRWSGEGGVEEILSEDNDYPFSIRTVVAITEDSDGYYGIRYDGNAALLSVKNSGKQVKLNLPSKVSDYPLAGIVIDDDMTSLEKIEIPDGLKFLAIDYSPELKTLEIPESMENLYLGCSGLETLEIPDGLKSLELGNCPALAKLGLSDSIETVRLVECPKLTKLEIPESVSDLENKLTLGNVPGYEGSLDNCLTIYCTEGSAAQRYAIDHMIPYIIGTIEKNKNDKPVFDETDYLVKKKALPAYEEYLRKEHPLSESVYQGFQLLYVNSDEIPELYYMISGWWGLLTYCAKTDEVVQCFWCNVNSGMEYKEKEGIVFVYEQHQGIYQSFYKLAEDSSKCELISSADAEDSVEPVYYTIDGKSVDEQTFWNYSNKYGKLSDGGNAPWGDFDDTTLLEVYESMKK